MRSARVQHITCEPIAVRRPQRAMAVSDNLCERRQAEPRRTRPDGGMWIAEYRA
jgi:hypothetical protein